DNTAYVAVNRMRIDDLHAYAFRTHDGGKTWQSIAAGLQDDAPVDAVRADPVQAGLLYAATERAVWTSFDDGAHWRSLEYNLPHTSMRDLLVHDDDLIVATHGRSFWVLDDIAPLPADEPAGENPPDGAIIDYALPQRAHVPVTLEIVDAKGGLVRRYSSDDPATPSPE